jgi:hypothetical protein
MKRSRKAVCVCVGEGVDSSDIFSILLSISGRFGDIFSSIYFPRDGLNVAVLKKNPKKTKKSCFIIQTIVVRKYKRKDDKFVTRQKIFSRDTAIVFR